MKGSKDQKLVAMALLRIKNATVAAKIKKQGRNTGRLLSDNIKSCFYKNMFDQISFKEYRINSI